MYRFVSKIKQGSPPFDLFTLYFNFIWQWCLNVIIDQTRLLG